MMTVSSRSPLQKKRQPWNILFHVFIIILVSLLFSTKCYATSAAALRVEGRFILLSNTNTSATDGRPPSCPETIDFTSIQTYRGINPNDKLETCDGILWSNLKVNGDTCTPSPYMSTSTYLKPSQPSSPDTPSDIANPWFLIGFDNSPLQCPRFTAKLSFHYYFTDDLPRFRDRAIRDSFLPIGIAANPLRGDIYLFAVGMDRGNDVRMPSCAYKHDGVEVTSSTGIIASPEASDEAGDGAVCLSARMTASVLQAHGSLIDNSYARSVRMPDLCIRDVVRTGWASHDGNNTDSIISFSHYDPGKWATFVVLQVLLPSNATRELEVTPSHVILHSDGATAHARSIMLGDRLLALEDGERISARVVQISSVSRRGVYSPVTQSGYLVVNDIVITCYTDAVADIASAHALLVPVRAAFWIGLGDWCHIIDFFRRSTSLWMTIGKV